jgi:hypothetical protein
MANEDTPQQSSGTPEPVPPIYREQLMSIAAASFLIGIGVWLTLKTGFRDEHERVQAVEVPDEFLVPVIITVFVGFVAPLCSELGTGLARGLARSSKTVPALPDRVLGILVYALTAAIVYALLRLVSFTGGLDQSPYSSLMTAPAVIGAFMAEERHTIAGLGIVGLATVWAAIALSDSTGGLKADEWVYAAMATVMLVIATTLSVVRHERGSTRGPLRERVRQRLQAAARRFRAIDVGPDGPIDPKAD